MIQAALEYFEQGLHPLVLDGKRPVGKWREIEWTRERIARCFKHAKSIGIDCGKSGRVVVDYDKEERIGIPEGGVIVKTPRGEHHHFRGRTGNRVNVLGKGIDIRSVGGLVRMPPTPGVFLFKDGELTDWNDSWLPHAEPLEVKSLAEGLGVDEKRYRARRYIARIKSVAGQGGDLALLRAATALVRRFELAPEVAMEELVIWNAYCCDPPWSEQRLRYKIFESIKLSHRQ